MSIEEICTLAKTQLDVRKVEKQKEHMNYGNAKKHAQPSAKQSTICSSCENSSQVTTPSSSIEKGKWN